MVQNRLLLCTSGTPPETADLAASRAATRHLVAEPRDGAAGWEMACSFRQHQPSESPETLGFELS